MLILRNYSKSFNAALILEIPNLSFETGVYWIKGDNGSGKTTLFKSIAGLLPFNGDIAFSDGISLHKDPVPFRKRINYSEAEPQYPGFLTAKDLIRFIGKLKGASIRQQDEMVSSFGIESYFENPCETYSSGMLKKLSLCLAFLGKPTLIILDEPLITLDQSAREILFGYIRQKVNEGAILLISSHHSIASHEIEVTQTYLLQNKTAILQ